MRKLFIIFTMLLCISPCFADGTNPYIIGIPTPVSGDWNPSLATDTNLVALWNFESGALTTDSDGTNTLVDMYTVQSDTDVGDFKQGSGSAYFDIVNDEYFKITDANLDADFPWKNAVAGTGSIVGWFRHDCDGANLYHKTIYSKTETGKASLLMKYGGAGYLTVFIGIAPGTSWETLYAHDDVFVQYTWYHFAFTFDNSSKAWTLFVEDAAGTDIIDTGGTATNNVNIEDADFEIGANNTGQKWDGWMDELKVFKDIVTDTEASQMRAGTY